MRKIVGGTIVLVTVSLWSCKKQELPTLPEGNEPIYTMSATVNGESLDLSVGRETIVMNNGVDEENGVLTYFGEMESELENEKFRIEFVRQEKPRKGNDIVVFQNNSVPFLVHQKGRVEFDFGGIGNQTSYMLFEDKNGNFVNTDYLELDEFGFIPVNVVFSDYGNGNVVFDFEVKHGYEEEGFNTAYHVQGSEGIIVLEAEMHDNYHEWYIDGVLVGTESVYEGEIIGGVHRIRHRVIDALGNESSSKSLVRFKGGKQFWDMKMNYTDESVFENNNFGRVIVSMFKDGEWYSSDHAISNQMENFKVDAVELIRNEGGDRQLMAFDFDFEAVLLNEDQSDSLILGDCNGKFIVGLE